MTAASPVMLFSEAAPKKAFCGMVVAPTGHAKDSRPVLENAYVPTSMTASSPVMVFSEAAL